MTESIKSGIDYSDTHQVIQVFVNAGMDEKAAATLIDFVQYWYQIGQRESKKKFADKTDITTLEQILQKLEEVQRNQATKDDVELAKLELRKEIEEVRSEGKRVELSLQGELKRVELSLQGEIKRVELSLEKQIEEVRSEGKQIELSLQKQIEDVKLTLEKQIEEVRSEGKQIELSLQKQIEEVKLTLEKQIEEVKLTLEKQIEEVKLTLEKQIEEVRSEGRRTELSLQKQIVESSKKTIIWVAGLIFAANAGLLTGIFLLFFNWIY